MSRILTVIAGALVAVAAIAAFVPDTSADAATQRVVVDFEGLAEGALVSTITSGSGASGSSFSGTIGVVGWRVADPGTQRAMVFDGKCLPAARRWGCTGQDPDLFFPDRGNILIVSEDLDASDPDDATDSVFRLDFSDLGSVTVESIGVLDTNSQRSRLTFTLASGSTVERRVAGTGDGRSVDVSVGIEQVVMLEIDMGGLGAIDDIVLAVLDTPVPTTTTSTIPATTTTTTVPATTTTVPAGTTTTTTSPGSTTTSTTVPATTTTTSVPLSTTTTTIAPVAALSVEVLIDGQPVVGTGPEVDSGATGTVTYRVTNLYTDKAYALYLKHAGFGVVACPDDALDPGETVVCERPIVFGAGSVSDLVTAKAWPENTDLIGTATFAYTASQPPGGSGFTNVAPTGVVTQAGGNWATGTPPSLAIDGDRNGDRDGGSVAMTYRVVAPWWDLDLGTSQAIDHIRLWNRTDCCADRLQRVHVFVSDEPFEVRDVANTASQPGVLDIYHHEVIGRDIELPVGRSGRYVRVQLDYQDAVLALAEVEVMVVDASPPPPPPPPALDLTVSTVGGPFADGDPVSFSYSVTNTGTARLWSTYVRHGAFGAAVCPDGPLMPGNTVVCSLDVERPAGDHTDTVTVKAWNDDGIEVSDVAEVEYVVAGTPPTTAAEIGVSVMLDGVPASVPGPTRTFGEPLAWTYQVTNEGTANLWAAYLKHGDAVVQCSERDLAPGESTVCSRNSSAAAGAHVESVVASAWDSDGVKVSASVDVGYVSDVSVDSRSMTMRATVAGDDAETAPGPVVVAGDPLPLEFTIENTGTESLYATWVSVPGFGTATCVERDIAPGASVTCFFDEAAQPGLFSSTARAVAYDGAGERIETFDRLHFFVPATTGAAVAVDVLVDGLNGSQNPRIGAGEIITFSYLVSNVGSVPLDSVTVSDDVHGSIQCPATTIAPGVMMVCTYAEVAVIQEGRIDTTVTAVGGTTSVSATDRAFFHVRERGREEALSLQVTINGADADNPPGPALEVGRTAQLRYVLTNTSTQTGVYSASVSDPRVPESQISCSGGPYLERGRSMICFATITVEAGSWASVPEGHGYGQNGSRIDTSDRVHYTGIL